MDLGITEETERLVRDLAAREGVEPDKAVRLAVEERLARQETSLERARRWLEDFERRHPPPADRTPLPRRFYDELNDEHDE